MRRCGKDDGKDRDRWDFTVKDANFFPMYVFQGGNMYGFCPGKATWDMETLWLFKLLIVSAESGTLLCSGGIAEQPSWFINMLSWFLPIYDNAKFAMKAKSILGDGKNGGRKGAVRSPGGGRLKRGSQGVQGR